MTKRGLTCLNEDHWIAATKDGGSFQNLSRAFSWNSCEEWPCPFVKCHTDEDQEYGYNGWLTYYDQFCDDKVFQEADDIKLPLEAREYIAIMYVHWKISDGKTF